MGVSAVSLVQTWLGLQGLVISSYAYYVEISNEADEEFEAMCDIGPGASCSAVMTSEYSKGFGIVAPLLGESHPLNVSIALLGLLFYSLALILGFFPSLQLPLLLLLCPGLAMDLYMAYVMVFVLRDFCIVCTSLYLTTVSLIIVVCYRVWNRKMRKRKSKKVQ